MILQIKQQEQKEQICKEILSTLPEWFGIPESTNEYIKESGNSPFWADIEHDIIRGFLALKETSPYTAEILVMGVKPEFHRQNIGKELFHACYKDTKQKGYEFLQVKTVATGYYEIYDRTNAFYKSLGFKEFECLPTLWCKENPCQIYIMSLKDNDTIK